MAGGNYTRTITATYTDDGETYTATAVVYITVRSSISFDESSYSLFGIDVPGNVETVQFTVTDDLDNDVTDECTYTLDSPLSGLTISDGAITIDGTIAAGTYQRTLTATLGQLTDTATIEITIQGEGD